MNYLTLLLPFFLGVMFIHGLRKKIDVFSVFASGVYEGLGLLKSLFPSFLLIFTAITVFCGSGTMDVIVSFLEPVTALIGFPAEVLPVAVLKPFSGSGANAMLESVFRKYGVDTFIGELSSVICASTETTFYTIGVYLSGLDGKFGKILFCSLVADVTSFAVAFCVVSAFA